MIKLIFTLILLTGIIFAAQNDLRFECISNEQGLPDNRVTSVLQDRDGFLWFGTLAGLVRYDGYGFEKYYKDPENPNGLSQNTVWDIIQDHDGYIWIGTFKGLNRLDPVTGKFDIFLKDPLNTESISSDLIRCMLEDSDHYLWIGTSYGLNLYNTVTGKFESIPDFGEYSDLLHTARIEDIYMDSRRRILLSIIEQNGKSAGVFCYDQVSKGFKKLVLHANHPEIETKNSVHDIYEDLYGNYWFGTEYGLIKYDPVSDQARFVIFYEKSTPGTDDSGINVIINDYDNGLWVGSGSNGLYHIDLTSEKIRNYRHEHPGQNCLSDDSVYDLYLDRTQNLWIATFGGGINKLHFQINPFRSYHPGGSDDITITSIWQTDNDNIWLGTNNDGLLQFDPLKNILTKHSLVYGSNVPVSNYVRNIYQTKSDELWLGLVGGIGIFDLTGKRLKYFSKLEKLSNTNQTVYVHRILSDEQGFIWAATNKGLCKINPVSLIITNVYLPDQANAQDEGRNGIVEIFFDTYNKLWIGTYSGLYQFNKSLEKFEQIEFRSKPGNSQNSNLVLAINEDNYGNIWVGTESGLYRLDRMSRKMSRFSTEQGMQNDFIHAIVSDKNNHIWVSTNWGLSQYIYGLQKFRNYDMTDGLPGNQFNNRAVYKNARNELLFGGENGLTVFQPDSIVESSFRPNVMITGFHGIRGEYRSDSTITYKKKVILDHDDNFFTIYYASLDYSAPHKNRYQYKLDGIDIDWVETSQRMVNYTDLEPGAYIFHLKGTNMDGVFTENEAKLQITIRPAWWASTFMYGIYFFALIGMITSIFWFSILRIKNRHKSHLDQMQLEKLKEINQLKSTFFANISHEFLTPLTLIDGTIKQLREGNILTNFNSQCDLIIRNTRQLNDLVNQLLDLAKLESGKVELKTRKVDAISLIKGLCDSFASITSLHDITIFFESSHKQLKLYLDVEKLEKIVNNLVSNAVKYTPDGGKITLRVQQLGVDFSPDEIDMMPLKLLSSESSEADSSLDMSGMKVPALVIQVINTGPGIPREKLGKIFERFYRLQDSQLGKQHGAGVGLALVSDLVGIHRGKISVTSEPDMETIFQVILPSVPGSSETDQTDRDFDFADEEIHTENPDSNANNITDILNRMKSRGIKETVLIIEDHADLRSYIANIFGSKYDILKAEDGATGLELAREHMPDLVISDVMMPGMQGFQFCEILKNDPVISHIPVILLTALTENEDKLRGLETGADDYITKPFESAELFTRAKNLIDQRKMMRDKFTHNPVIDSAEVTSTPKDMQFLSSLREIIEKNISDSNFTVPMLANYLGISRASLYRKVIALTGLTPVDLIRLTRLRYAYDLLKKQSGNVTNVAFEVGFTSISYFSRCFYRQYGLNPSDFIRQHQIIQ